MYGREWIARSTPFPFLALFLIDYGQGREVTLSTFAYISR